MNGTSVPVLCQVPNGQGGTGQSPGAAYNFTEAQTNEGFPPIGGRKGPAFCSVEFTPEITVLVTKYVLSK